jgi:short-subunit dehydrogenase
LRREVKEFGISVSLVEPGYVKTAIFDKSQLDIENAPHAIASPATIVSLYPKYHSEEATRKRIKATLQLASNVSTTTNAISHAITAKYPKTRYPVANAFGVPAPIIAGIIPYIPDRVVDAFL